MTTTANPMAPQRRPFHRRPQGILVIAAGALAALLIVVAVVGGDDAPTAPPKPDPDELLALYTEQLRTGKTCADRRKAVAKLRELGDKRAIPALERSRTRMRGGIAGFGDTNTNSCLRKDAEAAVAFLRER